MATTTALAAAASWAFERSRGTLAVFGYFCGFVENAPHMHSTRSFLKVVDKGVLRGFEACFLGLWGVNLPAVSRE